MNYQNRVCKDCGGVDFVEDRSQGDLTCTSCGLVAESHMIDETAEWRSFSDSDKAGADMNRVGGPINHLFADGLGTSIGEVTKGESNQAAVQALQRTNQRGSDPDRQLHSAVSVIGRLGNALALNRAIRDRGAELFKQTQPLNLVRGRSLEAVCCAVIYIACRLERSPRTFKEILARATGASQKEVGRAYRAMEQFLQEHASENPTTNHQPVGALHVADLLRRYCSLLGLGHADIRHAEAFAEAACPKHPSPEHETKPWDSRTPMTVAGAILFIITRMPRTSARPSLEAIAATVNAAESTIRLVANEMIPHAAEYIPKSLASTEETRQILKLQLLKQDA
ncbi:hypothetical protein WJX73_010802 [Symbiochloris irregularis]|uniref:General transcription factor TFIIB n=1 Tax=Symbiochloris irregularis TaxID=706552 RepID=A0AAW1Q0U7_9CHLO